MLSPPEPRRLDERVAVSLEDLVHANHCYRHLDRWPDPGFEREWVRDHYVD